VTNEQLPIFARVASTLWIESHVLCTRERPFEYLAEMANDCRSLAEKEAPIAAYELGGALSNLLSDVSWSRIDRMARQQHVSRHWLIHKSPEWRLLQKHAAAVMSAAGMPLHVWENAHI
jgi:hypothetical protein